MNLRERLPLLAVVSFSVVIIMLSVYGNNAILALFGMASGAFGLYTLKRHNFQGIKKEAE